MNPAMHRFVRYTTIGTLTFLFDLGMLYAAVSWLGVAYYVATPLSFLVAVSGNYALSRHFVFTGTERSWHGGYAFFIVAALLGASITTLLVAFLVSYFSLYFLTARVLVAVVVGVANYLFNLYFNFKVVGKHASVFKI